MCHILLIIQWLEQLIVYMQGSSPILNWRGCLQQKSLSFQIEIIYLIIYFLQRHEQRTVK